MTRLISFGGDVYKIAIAASLLFLLIAANTFIKILRDTIFLGHHSVSELPYLYIVVALVAGVCIAIYTRCTANLPLIRVVIATNASIVLSMLLFWLLLTYADAGWVHYTFYIWSAIVSVVAVAHVWTLANEVFTREEGTRGFGLVAAGGTLGGVAAAVALKWSLHASIQSNHMLWCIAGLYATAAVILRRAEPRLTKLTAQKQRESEPTFPEFRVRSVRELLLGSRLIKTIAMLIFVSVVVSTMIDFEFKAAAKEAYSTTPALAGFFSSYYGWLSVGTLLTQVALTRKSLSALGLTSSLYVTPGVLLAGSVAIMVWPSLLAAALTRMADATLRNSIHRSGMEIIYMAAPRDVVKRVKSFLDVVVERIGDASAGFIILLFSLSALERYINYVHLICVGLIFIWIGLIRSLPRGRLQSLRERRRQE